ncbi:MAG: GTP-binding protein [Thermofilum sp.]
MDLGQKLPQEAEDGNVEYKIALHRLDEERVERLASQMKYRLFEGGGEAIYVLGVDDQGNVIGLSEEEERESISILEKVSGKIGAKIRILSREIVQGKRIVRVLVRSSREESPPVQVTVAVVGNVDAGKSTTVGVLCTGQLDDGRGSSMRRVARYVHEILTGRTSSVTTRLLGFDLGGPPVNWSLPNPLDEAQIFLASRKVIYFVDVGGHERYLRTALRGILSREPDYVMLVVASNAGLQVMGREHLGLCLALRLPLIVVFTKTDLVDETVFKRNLEDTLTLLRKLDRKPVLVHTPQDAHRIAGFISSGRVVPVLSISNVTGRGLDSLLELLNLLPPRLRWVEKAGEPVLAYVSDIFNVRGVGLVVAVSILKGAVKEDSTLFIGPLQDGGWKQVRVKSIHVNRVPVSTARAGEEATLALSGIDEEEVEKGMVLRTSPAKPIRRILADVLILRHPTTIRVGYQTVLHAYSIRSPVVFEQMGKEPMRTGDRGTVTLKFLYHPWYIERGERFVLRDSRTRAIGTVLETLE